MTRIEELEQILNETAEKFNKEMNKFKAELEQIKALAELKESKKEGKWKPKGGEIYWYRNPNKTMYVRKWENDEVDNALYNNTPIFPTQSKCEKYWHFMDTVKEKSHEFSTDEWSTWGSVKYYIFYNYRNESFEVGNEHVTRDFDKIYFIDRESAQYIIDNFKEELMEYFL